MALTREDITLENFLKNFTYQSDQNAGNKIVLANEEFVKCAALLKIDVDLQRMTK